MLNIQFINYLLKKQSIDIKNNPMLECFKSTKTKMAFLK